MQNNIPKVISSVVDKDLCVGCGVCTHVCPSNSISVKWNNNGFLSVTNNGGCTNDGLCLLVCPFNPEPSDNLKTENEISDYIFNTHTNFHPKIGKHINIYVGYSNKHRANGSSGGIATFVLSELLRKGLVDYVVSVNYSSDYSSFKYSICSSINELQKTSKTRYYPVTLDNIFDEIQRLNGKFAITGVGCFVKAIRLAQIHNPLLKEKIVFIVGIICGGIKSKYFTDYLVQKTGIKNNHFILPEYRIKNPNSTATDYSFGCINKSDNTFRSIRMKEVGDMWGTGYFKAKACDFCDDVTTELSDISLGDAWFNPFIKNGAGTNIIISRSKLSDELMKKGIEDNTITVKNIPLEKLIQSQKGSYNHRQTGLSFRIKREKKKNSILPPKRHHGDKFLLSFKIVQYLRMIIRKKSTSIWIKHSNINDFDKRILKYRYALILATKIYHFQSSLYQKLHKKDK